MNRFFLRGLVLFVPLSGVALWAQAPVSLGPKQGVLLLRNGRTIEGDIVRDGDRYYVSLPVGEIRVHARDVVALCDDYLECYRHRRKGLLTGDVAQRLDLAAWLIDHDLLQQAEEELAAAAAIQGRHPRIPLVQRRLELAREGEPPAATAAAPRDEPREAQEEAKRADELIRRLPSGSVERFTSIVHPLLQNSCATGGCHGPGGASEFRLLRAPGGRSASARLTRNNLAAALGQVRRDAPEQSPLLTVPRAAHGGMSAPVFGDGDVAQYHHLLRWVYGLAQSSAAPKAPVSVDDPPPPLLQTDGGEDVRAESGEQRAERGEPSVEAEKGGPQRGAPIAGFTPRDAFDPEIFHRRHGLRPPGL